MVHHILLKDLQRNKVPTKTKAQQKQRDIQDKVGKSSNNSKEKDLVWTKTKKETKEILKSDRKTRSQTTSSTKNLRSSAEVRYTELKVYRIDPHKSEIAWFISLICT